MPTERQARGNDAETAAAHYLQRAGLQVLARNVRYKTGELDLVCTDGPSLVFVEVRRRAEGASAGRFGGAAASITPAKQRRMVRAAQTYLLQYGNRPPPARFDAVLVGGDGEVQWLKNIIS
jgi:putative endonuclease